MSVETAWHPLGLSNAVEPGASAGTHLFGRELVIWRDAGGGVHVWEDRCPHRGMKLSFGFVRGDHIACLYHGWQFDAAGQCRYIPAHPSLDVPQTIKVNRHSAIEQAGMIWTGQGEAPEPPPLAGFGETLPVCSLYLACSGPAALDAVRAHTLPPFAQQGGARPAGLEMLAENLYRLSNGVDGLLIGRQVLTEERTALHIVISGSAAIYAGTGQAHVLAWSIALRHHVETTREAA